DRPGKCVAAGGAEEGGAADRSGSVGEAAAVGRRWVLRWEEAMNGTPAAAVWCSLETGVDGLPSRLLFVGLAALGVGRESRKKKEGLWEQGRGRW
ncbi:hypothetical protein H0E87_008657, partial [Populus deltoides]